MSLTQWSIFNKNCTILLASVVIGTMNLKQIFGRNMRFYRYEKGLTQEELAEKVELNSSYISEIESGKYGPTFEKVELISRVLGIKAYLLFQENENTHKRLPNRVDMK